ncbi:hypothetical protein Tco_0883004 [Tanacetum coccineum]
MDTAYGRRRIRRIGNCEYAFTCEDLALIRRISFPGYGVLVNEMKMMSSELNLFDGTLAVQCAEYLKQLSQAEVLRMLELRRTIAVVHIQVQKKIDFLTVLRWDRIDDD